MIRMTQTVYDRWIAALRSGEYKQGTQYLRQMDNSFCCLGVLCDAAELKWDEGIEPDTIAYSLDENASVLPDDFEPEPNSDGNKNDWRTLYFGGMPVKWPDDWEYETHSCLALLNDESRVPFEKMADFIELNKDLLIQIAPESSVSDEQKQMVKQMVDDANRIADTKLTEMTA